MIEEKHYDEDVYRNLDFIGPEVDPAIDQQRKIVETLGGER